MRKKEMTWMDSFMATPGPLNLKEALILFLKGIFMGSADIIPGVSGGTIALITGIYENLLKAIKSVNLQFARNLFGGKLKDALTIIHARFLFILLSGIGIAIISLSRLMNFLLVVYPVSTWGFFFGLILASILLVGNKIDSWSYSTVLLFIIGTIGAYALMGTIPMTTSNAFPTIFFSGAIAICAMILPGISGAFILLILGKYTFITGALKQPFIPENLLVILVFSSGCIVGILAFSRILNYLLENHHEKTLAVLTGIMAGSLRKIWPWKETLETSWIEGKEYIISYRNIIPNSLNSNLLIPLFLAMVGFLLVTMLHYIALKKNQVKTS